LRSRVLNATKKKPRGSFGILSFKVRENSKDDEASHILQDMQNPFTLEYLHFLNYVLNYMNEFNRYFQSGGTLIHKLSDSSAKLLKKMCQNFIQTSALSHLDTLNISHPSNFVSTYLPIKNNIF